MDIQVDLGAKKGPVKPVNSTCNGVPPALKAYFQKAHIPYVRLHDSMVNSRFAVDIPAIFPNFSADENDPANYDFRLTDAYLGWIVDSGTKIIYRLGSSMEGGPVRFHNRPPEDFEKWARIACRIIEHYNAGWANGFGYGIEYWEIWNEPDGCNPGDRSMEGQWSGSDELFYDFYCRASAAIKKQHPELKIGGYASCAVDEPPRRIFFDGFLSYLEKHRHAFDFFSYHAYGDSIKKLTDRVDFITDRLAAHGFADTRILCTEYCYLWEYEGIWNDFGKPDSGSMRKQIYADMSGMKGAAYTMAAVITFQHLPVDIATLYRTDHSTMWCPVFDMFDLPLKPYFALLAFDELACRKTELACETDCGGVYAMAAGSAEDFALAVSDYTGGDRQCRVGFAGADGEYELVYRLTDTDHDNAVVKTERRRLDGGINLYLRAPTFITVTGRRVS